MKDSLPSIPEEQIMMISTAASPNTAATASRNTATGGNKPRLTYSSVIHSLVEQLTRRSPFLQQHQKLGEEYDDEMSASQDHNDPSSKIMMLDRKEVQTGALLGQGNFSNVFEVIGFQLQHQILPLPTRQSSCDTLDDEQQQQIIMAPCFVNGEVQQRSSSRLCKARKDEEASDTRDNCDTLHPYDEIEEPMQEETPVSEDDHDKRRKYAIKCLKPELLESSTPKAFLEAATDLVVEARYLTRLNHPNILKVRGIAKGWESAFENGEYDSFFILMDRLEETLSKRIRRWRHGEFPKENTLERKLHVALQIASALEYLHERRLVLRDIKPNNIGILKNKSNEDDSLDRIQLFDFGFCRELPIVQQGRHDIVDVIPEFSHVSTLASGETVFLMSGKGTRYVDA